jgi:hypothetical protein
VIPVPDGRIQDLVVVNSLLIVSGLAPSSAVCCSHVEVFVDIDLDMDDAIHHCQSDVLTASFQGFPLELVQHPCNAAWCSFPVVVGDVAHISKLDLFDGLDQVFTGRYGLLCTCCKMWQSNEATLYTGNVTLLGVKAHDPCTGPDL